MVGLPGYSDPTMKLIAVLLLVSLATSLCAAQRSFIGDIEPQDGSLFGGTVVTITGAGFASRRDAAASLPLVFFGTQPCDVVDYHTSPRHIECVTRAFSAYRFNPLPDGPFNASATYPFVPEEQVTAADSRVTVRVFVPDESGELNEAACNTNCNFDFEDSRSPEVVHQSPDVFPGGMMAVKGTLRTNDPLQYAVRVGGEPCETDEKRRGHGGLHSEGTPTGTLATRIMQLVVERLSRGAQGSVGAPDVIVPPKSGGSATLDVVGDAVYAEMNSTEQLRWGLKALRSGGFRDLWAAGLLLAEEQWGDVSAADVTEEFNATWSAYGGKCYPRTGGVLSSRALWAAEYALAGWERDSSDPDNAKGDLINGDSLDSYFQCRVGQQPAGRVMSSVVSGEYGLARSAPSVRRVELPSDRVFSATVVPTVSHLSHHRSGTNGGDMITIRGSGFAPHIDRAYLNGHSLSHLSALAEGLALSESGEKRAAHAVSDLEAAELYVRVGRAPGFVDAHGNLTYLWHGYENCAESRPRYAADVDKTVRCRVLVSSAEVLVCLTEALVAPLAPPSQDTPSLSVAEGGVAEAQEWGRATLGAFFPYRAGSRGLRARVWFNQARSSSQYRSFQTQHNPRYPADPHLTFVSQSLLGMGWGGDSASSSGAMNDRQDLETALHSLERAWTVRRAGQALTQSDTSLALLPDYEDGSLSGSWVQSDSTSRRGYSFNDFAAEHDGWFIPPYTGNYSFYARGDDYVHVELSTDHTPTRLRSVAKSGYTLDYWQTSSQRDHRPQVSLLRGVPYYLRVRSHEYGGASYHRVAVRIHDRTTGENQRAYSSVPMSLRLTSAVDLRREQVVVRVTGVTGGSFRLVWGNRPGFQAASTVVSDPLDWDASTSQMSSAFKEFFWVKGRRYCSSISVARAAAYENDVVDPANLWGYEYTVTFNCPLHIGDGVDDGLEPEGRLLPQVLNNGLSVWPGLNAAALSAARVQTPNQPLRGSVAVGFTFNNGTHDLLVAGTHALAWNTEAWRIARALQMSAGLVAHEVTPGSGRVAVRDLTDSKYWGDSRALAVQLSGYDSNLTSSNLMLDLRDASGSNVSVTVTVDEENSDDVFVDPISADWLRVAHEVNAWTGTGSQVPVAPPSDSPEYSAFAAQHPPSQAAQRGAVFNFSAWGHALHLGGQVQYLHDASGQAVETDGSAFTSTVNLTASWAALAEQAGALDAPVQLWSNGIKAACVPDDRMYPLHPWSLSAACDFGFRSHLAPLVQDVLNSTGHSLLGGGVPVTPGQVLTIQGAGFDAPTALPDFARSVEQYLVNGNAAAMGDAELQEMLVAALPYSEEAVSSMLKEGVISLPRLLSASDPVQVRIGRGVNAPLCEISTVSDSSVECVVPNLPAGPQPLFVSVWGRGQARFALGSDQLQDDFSLPVSVGYLGGAACPVGRQVGSLRNPYNYWQSAVSRAADSGFSADAASQVNATAVRQWHDVAGVHSPEPLMTRSTDLVLGSAVSVSAAFPRNVSVAGGAVLRLQGKGLSQESQVMVGGRVCEVVESSVLSELSELMEGPVKSDDRNGRGSARFQRLVRERMRRWLARQARRVSQRQRKRRDLIAQGLGDRVSGGESGLERRYVELACLVPAFDPRTIADNSSIVVVSGTGDRRDTRYLVNVTVDGVPVVLGADGAPYLEADPGNVGALDAEDVFWLAYDGTLTPVITGMTPKFVSAGATKTITLTGSGFTAGFDKQWDGQEVLQSAALREAVDVVSNRLANSLSGQGVDVLAGVTHGLGGISDALNVPGARTSGVSADSQNLIDTRPDLQDYLTVMVGQAPCLVTYLTDAEIRCLLQRSSPAPTGTRGNDEETAAPTKQTFQNALSVNTEVSLLSVVLGTTSQDVAVTRWVREDAPQGGPYSRGDSGLAVDSVTAQCGFRHHPPTQDEMCAEFDQHTVMQREYESTAPHGLHRMRGRGAHCHRDDPSDDGDDRGVSAYSPYYRFNQCDAEMRQIWLEDQAFAPVFDYYGEDERDSVVDHHHHHHHHHHRGHADHHMHADSELDVLVDFRGIGLAVREDVMENRWPATQDETPETIEQDERFEKLSREILVERIYTNGTVGSITTGSLRGGQVITIQGKGFPAHHEYAGFGADPQSSSMQATAYNYAVNDGGVDGGKSSLVAVTLRYHLHEPGHNAGILTTIEELDASLSPPPVNAFGVLVGDRHHRDRDCQVIFSNETSIVCVTPALFEFGGSIADSGVHEDLLNYTLGNDDMTVNVEVVVKVQGIPSRCAQSNFPSLFVPNLPANASFDLPVNESELVRACNTTLHTHYFPTCGFVQAFSGTPVLRSAIFVHSGSAHGVVGPSSGLSVQLQGSRLVNRGNPFVPGSAGEGLGDIQVRLTPFSGSGGDAVLCAVTGVSAGVGQGEDSVTCSVPEAGLAAGAYRVQLWTAGRGLAYDANAVDGGMVLLHSTMAVHGWNVTATQATLGGSLAGYHRITIAGAGFSEASVARLVPFDRPGSVQYQAYQQALTAGYSGFLQRNASSNVMTPSSVDAFQSWNFQEYMTADSDAVDPLAWPPSRSFAYLRDVTALSSTVGLPSEGPGYPANGGGGAHFTSSLDVDVHFVPALPVVSVTPTEMVVLTPALPKSLVNAVYGLAQFGASTDPSDLYLPAFPFYLTVDTHYTDAFNQTSLDGSAGSYGPYGFHHTVASWSCGQDHASVHVYADGVDTAPTLVSGAVGSLNDTVFARTHVSNVQDALGTCVYMYGLQYTPVVTETTPESGERGTAVSLTVENLRSLHDPRRGLDALSEPEIEIGVDADPLVSFNRWASSFAWHRGFHNRYNASEPLFHVHVGSVLCPVDDGASSLPTVARQSFDFSGGDDFWTAARADTAHTLGCVVGEVPAGERRVSLTLSNVGAALFTNSLTGNAVSTAVPEGDPLRLPTTTFTSSLALAAPTVPDALGAYPTGQSQATIDAYVADVQQWYVHKHHSGYGGGILLTINGVGFPQFSASDADSHLVSSSIPAFLGGAGAASHSHGASGASVPTGKTAPLPLWASGTSHHHHSHMSSSSEGTVMVSVCGSRCRLVSSQYDEMVCSVPPIRARGIIGQFQETSLLDDGAGTLGGGVQKLVPSGFLGSRVSSWRQKNAFDGNVNTEVIADGSQDCYVGLDIGEGKTAVLSHIRFYSPFRYPTRPAGSVFEQSVDGETWTQVAVVQAPVQAGWNHLQVLDQACNPGAGDPEPAVARYFRVRNGWQTRCHFAEVEFWGLRVDPAEHTELTDSVADHVSTCEVDVSYLSYGHYPTINQHSFHADDLSVRMGLAAGGPDTAPAGYSGVVGFATGRGVDGVDGGLVEYMKSELTDVANSLAPEGTWASWQQLRWSDVFAAENAGDYTGNEALAVADAVGENPVPFVAGKVSFTTTQTPMVSSLFPAFGSSRGGEVVTVYGQGFMPDAHVGMHTLASHSAAPLSSHFAALLHHASSRHGVDALSSDHHHDHAPHSAGFNASQGAVWLNGFACVDQEVFNITGNGTSHTHIECTTTARDTTVFYELSTHVYVAGKGYALSAPVTRVDFDSPSSVLCARDIPSIDTAHTNFSDPNPMGLQRGWYFRYLDRWSDPNTWLNNNLPVSGDTVVVPLGQTLLMDVSPPPLFLFLVQGEVVVSPHVDIDMEVHYLMIKGGAFEVGSENAPHLRQFVLTVRGDKYKTLEIPEIGSKCVAVMNREFHHHHDGSHLNTQSTVRSGVPLTDSQAYRLGIGRLDLHGRPGIVWTKVSSLPGGGGYGPAGTSSHAFSAGDRSRTFGGPSFDQLAALNTTHEVSQTQSYTIQAGDLSFPVVHSVRNSWFPGDRILVTSSTKSFYQTEELTIRNVSADGLIVEVEAPGFRFSHSSTLLYVPDYIDAGDTEHFNSIVDLRVEASLISSNVRVQGDERSTAQNFGVHTMSAHGGVYRVEGVEITRCGQGGNLGRYCTHFHMAQDMQLSYIRYNRIHHSFQRAVTVHTTHYSKVVGNLAYHVKGHTFFVEDGLEIQNTIAYNLGVWTLKLPNMISSDTKPATFWQATPENFWRYNVAAGSVSFGYWFELVGHPTGPSFTTSECPNRGRLGEFSFNHAHSNGGHGLRVYPFWQPLYQPCGGSLPMETHLYNFTSWRNGGAGIFHKKVGALHHHFHALVENGMGVDWKKHGAVRYHPNSISHYETFYNHSDPNSQSIEPHGDNVAAGDRIDFTYHTPQKPHLANLHNMLVISRLDYGGISYTNGVAGPRVGGSGVGVWAPQGERFWMSGVWFVNFHGRSQLGQSPGGRLGSVRSNAPIRGCNDCGSDNDMSQGGYTYRSDGLRFVNSPNRVKFTWPYKQIFHDLDGTLVDSADLPSLSTADGGYLVGGFYPHVLANAACELAEDSATPVSGQVGAGVDRGIVCVGAAVRRVAVYGGEPSSLDWVPLNVTAVTGDGENDNYALLPPQDEYFDSGRTLTSNNDATNYLSPTNPNNVNVSHTSSDSSAIPFYPRDVYGWVLPAVAGDTYRMQFLTARITAPVKVTDTTGATQTQMVTYREDLQQVRLVYGHYSYLPVGEVEWERDAVGDYVPTVNSAGEHLTLRLPYNEYRHHFDVQVSNPPRFPNGRRIPALQLPAADSIDAVNSPYGTNVLDALPSEAPQGDWNGNPAVRPSEPNALTLLLSSTFAPTTGNMEARVFARLCPDGGCPIPDGPEVGSPMLWSSPATWAALAQPQPLSAGMHVVIPNTAWVIFDVDTTPVLASVTVYGRLEFDDNAPGSGWEESVDGEGNTVLTRSNQGTLDLHLRTESLVVYGQLWGGTDPQAPLLKPTTIELNGGPNTVTVVVGEDSFVGQKTMVCVGECKLYGQAPAFYSAQLQFSAAAGDSVIYLPTAVAVDGTDGLLKTDIAAGLQVGDELLISGGGFPVPSDTEGHRSERVTVSGVASATVQSQSVVEVTLSAPLRFPHGLYQPQEYTRLDTLPQSDATGLQQLLRPTVHLVSRALQITSVGGGVVRDEPQDTVTESQSPGAYRYRGFGGHVYVVQTPEYASNTNLPLWMKFPDTKFYNLRFHRLGKTGTSYSALNMQYRTSGTTHPWPYAPQWGSASAEEKAQAPLPVVSGCAFTDVLNTGMEVRGVGDLVVHRTVFQTPYKYGIFLDAQSRNATVTSSVVMDVRRLPASNQDWYVPVAGIYVNAVPFEVAENVVYGSRDLGLVLPPSVCVRPDVTAGSGDSEATVYSAGGHGGVTGGQGESGGPGVHDNAAIGCLVGLMVLSHGAVTGIQYNDNLGSSYFNPGLNCALVDGYAGAHHGHLGIMSIDQTADILAVRNALVVDSHIGFDANFFGSLGGAQQTDSQVHVFDSVFLGALNDTDDCAASNRPNHCYAVTASDVTGFSLGSGAAPGVSTCGSVFPHKTHVGIVTPIFYNKGKTCPFTSDISVCRPSLVPGRMCGMPWEKRFGLPSVRNARLFVDQVHFDLFTQSRCGLSTNSARNSETSAIAWNPGSRDYTPRIDVSGLTFGADTDYEARLGVQVTPDSEPTCGPKDVGSGGHVDNCDGLFQWGGVVDTDGSLTAGSSGTPFDDLAGTAHGVVVSSVAAAQGFASMGTGVCEDFAAWGSVAVCHSARRFPSDTALSHVPIPFLVEPMGGEGRNFGPFSYHEVVAPPAVDAGQEYNHTFASHGPIDDMCPLRLAFPYFPAQLLPHREYNAQFAATPPGHARFTMMSRDPTHEVVLRIFYSKPNDLVVYSNDVRVPDTADSTPAHTNPVLPAVGQGDASGTNVFDAQGRTLHVLIRGGPGLGSEMFPRIDVRVTPTLRLNFHLRMEVNDFLGDNLVTNLAVYLQIPPHRIRVVSVNAGSTVATVEVSDTSVLDGSSYDEAVEQNAVDAMSAVSDTIITGIEDGTLDLGQGDEANVLSLTVFAPTVEDPSAETSAGSTTCFSDCDSDSIDWTFIAIAVGGGVIFILAIALTVWYVCRRRKQQKTASGEDEFSQQHDDSLWGRPMTPSPRTATKSVPVDPEVPKEAAAPSDQRSAKYMFDENDLDGLDDELEMPDAPITVLHSANSKKGHKHAPSVSFSAHDVLQNSLGVTRMLSPKRSPVPAALLANPSTNLPGTVISVSPKRKQRAMDRQASHGRLNSTEVSSPKGHRRAVSMADTEMKQSPSGRKLRSLASIRSGDDGKRVSPAVSGRTGRQQAWTDELRGALAQRGAVRNPLHSQPMTPPKHFTVRHPEDDSPNEATMEARLLKIGKPVMMPKLQVETRFSKYT